MVICRGGKKMKRDAQLSADVSAEPRFEPCHTRPRIGFWSVSGADTGPLLRSNDDGSMRGRIFLPLTPFCRRGDAELMHSASETLQSITEVPTDYVAIQVANGWITLSGTVDWRWQRDAVVNAMRRLVGVTGVGDGIEVRPDLSLNAALPPCGIAASESGG